MTLFSQDGQPGLRPTACLVSTDSFGKRHDYEQIRQNSLDKYRASVLDQTGDRLRRIRDAIGGRIPPTLLAETPEGMIVYLPESMGDERAKDNFANTARLAAATYLQLRCRGPHSGIVDDSVARPGDPFVPIVPPSQSPNRQEVVLIQAESEKALSSVLLRI